MKKTNMHWNLCFLLLVVLVATCFFAGCGQGNEEDKIISQGYKNIVTFDGNGGKMGDYPVRYRYLKDNSLLQDPSALSGNYQATYELHTFLGWYEGTKDEEGVVNFESNPFDFMNTRINSSFTLYAKWSRDFTYQLVYMQEDPITNTLSSLEVESINDDGEKTSVQVEEYKKTNAGTKLSDTVSISSLSKTGYTAYDFYQDENCTKLWDDTYEHEGDVENPDVKVYVKWFVGNYVLAKEKKDLQKISSASNIYLCNDIDMENEAWDIMVQYRGIFLGNGYTISNITMNYLDFTNFDIGLFGSLMGAYMRDVSFHNVSIEVKYTKEQINQSVKVVGMLGSSIEASTIKNIVFDQCVITLTQLEGVSVNVDKNEPYYWGVDNGENTIESISGEIIFNEYEGGQNE